MQNIEHDFISGVLSEEELGNTMHVHEVKSGFACQIRNLRSYDAVSRAVLQRWAFPLAVDNGLLNPAASETSYSYKRQNRYRYVSEAMTAMSLLGTMHNNFNTTCNMSGKSQVLSNQTASQALQEDYQIQRLARTAGPFAFGVQCKL